jgi:DNA-binding NtrC family response regulator
MPPERDDGDLSTLMVQRFVSSPAPAASFVVAVSDGVDRGASLKIDGSQPGRSYVGQGPLCDLKLTDRAVSRRHLAVELVGDRLRVTDLSSKNGTVVDRIAVTDAFLTGGETIKIGSTTLSVKKDAPAKDLDLGGAVRFGQVVGASREMRRIYPLCEKLAQGRVPVVIEGETGTGKEVLAQSLHELGPRAQGPFVVFDCTAVPANLMESELFGHERGAFTGAVSSRKGVLEEANGGTLLVDEIGDLDVSLQPKLLRALERGEVRRVGGDKWIKVDVRILAATRRNLDIEVQEGRFRDDLFHRLAVARVELPPLRARKGDIPVLAEHFCEELGGDKRMLTPDLLARWEADPWPGNVRELRNAVARELTLGELSEMAHSRPSERPTAAAPTSAMQSWVKELIAERLMLVDARKRVVAEFERAYVDECLAQNGGNVTRAAATAGIPRRYFQILKAKLAK